MPIDNELNPVIGIDLGTTFSAIARWHEKRKEPRHYEHSLEKETLQSVVYCHPETQEFLVGKVAYRRGLIDPDNMVIGIKRKMDNALEKIIIGSQEFTPIQLSAEILKNLYQDIVKQHAGQLKSRGTVVTVPYYFKAHQRNNTLEAAKLADINCIALIEEPIAASLAYAWQIVQDNPDKKLGENILVFDLGGGTFDLTLFRLEQTKEKLSFEVIATGGDDRLGGMDFDQALLNLLLERSGLTLDGLSEIEERKARVKLIENAIEAKITLTSAQETYVSIADVIYGKNIETKLTRADFEKAIEPYTKKISSVMEKLWSVSKMRPGEINRVILVGGSSRIPKIKSLVYELIDEKKVYGNTNASLSVAEGAAMYAAYLDDREVFGKTIEIKTRTSHALGVEMAGGKFFEIISANRNTPCEQSQIFTTDTDNMTSLDIEVYQGSAPKVEDNSKIGTFNIIGLPERPAGELEVSVKFKLTQEQNLSVTVECEGMRKAAVFKFT